MRPGNLIHYLLSTIAGMVSFVLGYGLLQDVSGRPRRAAS
jgi:hypothetical protein